MKRYNNIFLAALFGATLLLGGCREEEKIADDLVDRVVSLFRQCLIYGRKHQLHTGLRFCLYLEVLCIS